MQWSYLSTPSSAPGRDKKLPNLSLFLIRQTTQMPNYSPYTESTKQRIVKYVHQYPAHTGREIAIALGLDKSRVNSFLYSEGRTRFNLRVDNWRWTAYAWTPPTQPRPPEPDPTPRRYSICDALIQINITDATLKIRAMNETTVNLVFAEDKYNLLDDRLKAELAIRRQELLASKPTEAKHKSPLSNPLVLIAIGLMAFFFIGNLMNNSSTEPSPTRSIPESTR